MENVEMNNEKNQIAEIEWEQKGLIVLIAGNYFLSEKKAAVDKSLNI